MKQLLKHSVFQSGFSTLFSALVLVLFFAGPGLFAEGPTAGPTALDELQGFWAGEGPDGECSVSITDNLLRFADREGYWSETEFIMPAGSGQIHATILTDSTEMQIDKGAIVVALFKIEGDALTLGLAETFRETPPGPVEEDWEKVTQVFKFHRSEPGLWALGAL